MKVKIERTVRGNRTVGRIWVISGPHKYCEGYNILFPFDINKDEKEDRN